jgi:hypothetical protein
MYEFEFISVPEIINRLKKYQNKIQIDKSLKYDHKRFRKYLDILGEIELMVHILYRYHYEENNVSLEQHKEIQTLIPIYNELEKNWNNFYASLKN